MSMNNNLEVKVSELTDVIRGLSNKPFVEASDLNNVLNNFVKRVEDSNELNISKITDEMSDALINALNEKYKEIQERLSLFENFAASVEKTIQNSKTESEITRILNDIEALHSKMNSQELQTENLINAFDAVKNSSSAGQVSRLADEIVSISKSYDGIVEVLNNNFQEFLRRVEAQGSKEDIQRLRYFLESLENNQNVLVSAMNVVNDKQEEIKNIVRQSSSAQAIEKMEYIQNAINQLNRTAIDAATKADLEIVSDKISQTMGFISEFKRQYTDDNSADVKNILQGQLNNIISKLESLKFDNSSNVNEDIIRLYTSVAEFKDGVYSAINNQLNDVITSMDVQFDKISNSVVNSTLDNNEAINHLTGEIQKAQSIMSEGLDGKIASIKEEIQKQNRENAITVVNSLKGELEVLKNNLSSANNNENIQNLVNAIDGLKSGLDIDTILIQIDQIKSALDFTPIKEQIELLNKDETINLINQKIDRLFEISNADKILNKLEEVSSVLNPDNLYSALNSINSKIDFSYLDEKLNSIKDYLSKGGLDDKLLNINEKLNIVENINEEIVSIKNIDYALNEIKTSIEEYFRLSNEKNNQDRQNQQDIKDALKTIYEKLQDEYKFDELKNLVNSLKEVKFLPQGTNLNYGDLKENFVSVNENFDNLNKKIDEIKNENSASIQRVLNSISQNWNSSSDNAQAQNNLDFNTELYDVANSIRDDINSQGSRLTGSVIELQAEVKDVQGNIKEDLNTFNKYIQNKFESLDESFVNSINEISEKINLLNISSNEGYDKQALDDVKEQIITVNESIKRISENSISDQLSNLEQSILAANIDNTNITRELVQQIQASVLENIQSVRGSILAHGRQVPFNETVIPLFDEFETRLNDKIVSLETLIEETGKTGNDGLQEVLLQEINQTKTELQNQIKVIVEGANEAQKALLGELIKAQLNELQLDSVNYLKQESEILTSFVTENLEVQTKEIVSKFVQILNAKENSEVRINLIKTITGNISEILENSNFIKEGFSSFNAQFEEISSASKAVNGLLEDFTNKLGLDFEKAFSNLDEKFNSFDLQIKEILSENNSNLMDKLTSVVDFANEISSKLVNLDSENNSNLELSVNAIIENVKDLEEKLKETVEEKTNNLEDKLISINNAFEFLKEKVENSLDEQKNSIEGAANLINLGFDESKADFRNISEGNKKELLDTIQSLKDNINLIEANIEILAKKDGQDSNLIFDKIISQISAIAMNLQEINANNLEEIKGKFLNLNDDINSIKSNLEAIFANQASNNEEHFENLNANINLIQDNIKTSMEAFISNLNEKYSQIQNDINGIHPDLKEIIEDTVSGLNEKYGQIQDVINNIRPDLKESISAEISDIKEQCLQFAENLNSMQSGLFEINANNLEEIKGKFLNLNDDINSIKSNLEAIFANQASNNEEHFENLNANINLIQDNIKTSMEAFISNLNEKYSQIQNDINGIHPDLKEIIEDTVSNLNEKYGQIQDNINNIQPDLKEAISAEISDIKAHCEKLAETVDIMGENLDNSLNKTDLTLKDYFDDTKRSVNAIQAIVENMGDSVKTNQEEINNFVQEIKTENVEIKSDIESKLQHLIEKISEVEKKEVLGEQDLTTLKENIIQAFENLSSSKNEILYNEIKTVFDEDKIGDIKNSIVYALNNSSDSRKATVIEKIEENANNIHQNINEFKDQTNSIKQGIISSISEKEELIQNSITNLKYDVQNAKNEINNNAQGLIEQLKQEMEDIKGSIQSKIAESDNKEELVTTLINSFEEKMQEKVSVLENVIDSSFSNLDEKTIETLNRANEDYKKALDNRVDFILEKLQTEYEDKLTDIQKLIDNRIYEIINKNNDIIKDEIKYSANSTIKDITQEFSNKIAKIESVLVKEENEEGEKQGYTLADVESDIAKIRLGLEKTNKLTNFKEFASRLVELKNINLENAKISRVIGSDIMRFDTWLKNTTAKIDLLAAKIEKSEKIKMEDLKSRLIQTEKNQAMPQKVEEAIMTIYKKYRVQETKIEEMINKMDSLVQKQSDTFDIKEFIDLFYDNTKKQDNLISRMDGIEDKMDYMQAKIDHIISSCIDE